jgi:Skp family chaperone for outer membrane proteins
MKKLTTILLISLITGAGLFAQKTPVMATVNVQRVLNEYSAFQAAVEKVRGSVAPAEQEMQKMRDSIQQIVTDGRDAETKMKNPALGDEAREEATQAVEVLRQKLAQEQQRMEQFRQQAQQLAQQGQQTELEPLQAKAIEAVKTVAKDKGIDMVVPLNTVIFADDSMEISDAVIALLNSAK